MLARMWQLSIPWWELILRVVIIYAFLLVLIRFSGKRQVGQLAPFDLVLLLVLSNAVQNAMNGGDNSVLAGLISAGALVLVNYLVGLATYKSKRLAALVSRKCILAFWKTTASSACSPERNEPRNRANAEAAAKEKELNT